MPCFVINGGFPLHGEVQVQGAKNAVLPIMAASILNCGITVLTHVPRITDVADMKEILDTCAQAVGANGKTQGGYPAWEYKVDSELRKVMVETFVEQYGKEPVVSTIHAGLECGLFLGKKPDLDCVSMGPDLLDIHSFNEKLDIASTQRTWEYLKGILAKLK